MDGHDQVPILVFHVLEADIPKDTGVVDQDINPAKVLNGGLDDLVSILDRVVVCCGFSTSSLDLIDDYIGGLK